MVLHLHDDGLAVAQDSLRRLERPKERQADAVQRHARHLDALLVERLERRAVDLADARAGKLVEREEAARLVELRQARAQACLLYTSRPIASSGPSMSWETAGSPSQPRASEANVMPSWQAER